MRKRNKNNGFSRLVKKFLLSAFVVISFIGYALENHGASANSGTPVTGAANPSRGLAPTANSSNTSDSQPTLQSATNTDPTQQAASTDAPAPTNTPTAQSPAIVNGFKDGTYTGQAVDVNWGLVQVQAKIQSGKINDVQFLQYPKDRRTSAFINSIADPMLQQEAVQAQSANVDIITGATLTSEGFQMSLQDALNQAKG